MSEVGGDDCCAVDLIAGRCLKGGRWEITDPECPYEPTYSCDQHVLAMLAPGQTAASRYGGRATIKYEKD